MKHLVRETSLVLLLMAQVGFTTAARQAPQSGASGGITEITLQRTWCYGACPVDTLVLAADGTAVYTGKQNTRLTGQFTGTFWKGDFDRLAQWLVSEGFFELKDRYGRPNVDLPTQMIRVARGGEHKSVVNQSGGSEVVWGMERIIRGAAADMQWQPVHSGIRGVATWKPAGADAWRPLPDEVILIYPSDDKQEYGIRTDHEGRFEIALIPGTYKIEPLIFGRSPQVATPPRVNPLQTLVVHPDRFGDASFQFDRATGKTLMADGIPASGGGPAQK